jgi:hypothetical protein
MGRLLRLLHIGLCLSAFVLTLGVDVGESWRAGTIRSGSAHAKRHRKRHKRRRRHKRRNSAPATEM